MVFMSHVSMQYKESINTQTLAVLSVYVILNQCSSTTLKINVVVIVTVAAVWYSNLIGENAYSLLT